ncbi:MAG: hypothetical protein AAFN63_17545, partial [Pseudomonadota bacterium]
TRQIRQTGKAPLSLHLSGVDRLPVEQLWPARSKPLIFRESGADALDLMGPDPKVPTKAL